MAGLPRLRTPQSERSEQLPSPRALPIHVGLPGRARLKVLGLCYNGKIINQPIMSTLDLARHEQINVLDDIVELVSPNVWVTGGVVLLAPFILPVIIKGLRPVVKGTIKGYLTIQDKVKEYAAVTSEQMSDLIAEVRAEHAAAGTIAAVESVMVEAPSVEVKKSPSRESSKKSE